MPPFDRIMPNIPMGLDSPMEDFVGAVWRTPLDMGRMPLPEPGQLAFPDIFQQVGALAAENPLRGMEDVFQNASNVEFSTPEQNQKSGKQPDFFVNAAGKLTKNPNRQSKPGDPLNVEIQSDRNEFMSQLQGSVIQSIIDKFLSNHPGMESFPHTWQEVLQRLHQATNGNAEDASGGDNTAYGAPTGSASGGSGGDGIRNGNGAGDRNNGGSGNYPVGNDAGVGDSGSAPIRPVNDLAPPVEVKGKVFPVSGYHGGKVQLHHGSSDGASDIFAPEGTPIFTMLGGEVVGVGSGGLGGNTITVRQKDGNLAYYAHMQAQAAKADGTPLKAGDKLETGEVLGRVGQTGNAAGTGSHLHIGVGREIQNGSGPEGGAGTNFDLTDTLNVILATSRSV